MMPLPCVALVVLGVGCQAWTFVGDAADGESTRGEDQASSGGVVDPSTTTGIDTGSDLDGTGETATSYGGSGFLVALDTGSQTIACELWMQDCPPGEKCMPWSHDGGSSWNAVRCAPIDPNAVAVGEACTVEGSGVSGIDNCERGSMCWNVDGETLIGTCVAMCKGSEGNPVCVDPRAECYISSGVIALCLPSCDPLLQDCDDGLACYPNHDWFSCAPDAGGEQGLFGDACAFINACDPGLFCAAPDDVPGCNSRGCCSSLCDISDPDASEGCPGADGGQECVAWYEEGHAPFGHENVGACAIPT